MLKSKYPVCQRSGEDGRPVMTDLPSEVDADFVLLLTGYRQNTRLLDMVGIDMQGPDRQPRFDPETMETNVPGVFIAGTAIAGTPRERVRVIVESCHVHVPRILAAITGQPVALPDGKLDD